MNRYGFLLCMALVSILCAIIIYGSTRPMSAEEYQSYVDRVIDRQQR